MHGLGGGAEIYCIFIAFFGKKKPDAAMHRVSFFMIVLLMG
jgi:hypothetical protein